MLSPLGQVRQISVGNKKAKSHWQYHWYCAMYVLFDMIRKANVYPHDPFTGKGHHLYLSLILRTYDLSAVADPGKGPGGPHPLIFRPKWGPKGRKNQGLDDPPPPPLIRRSGSATVSSASPTLILQKFGNHVTVHCPSDRPSFAPQAHQYNVTQSTGMATQMQRMKIACPPELLVIKTTTTKSRLSTLFLMFTLMRMRKKELGRRISLEEKHENFIAAVRKWEMLAARWKWATVKK